MKRCFLSANKTDDLQSSFKTLFPQVKELTQDMIPLRIKDPDKKTKRQKRGKKEKRRKRQKEGGKVLTLCLHINIANKTPESATSCNIAPAACLVA